MTQGTIRNLKKKISKKEALREMKAKLMICYSNCKAYIEAIRDEMKNLEMSVLADLEDQKKAFFDGLEATLKFKEDIASARCEMLGTALTEELKIKLNKKIQHQNELISANNHLITLQKARINTIEEAFIEAEEKMDDAVFQCFD